MNAGYAGTPLVNKLGLKAGARACILDAPPHYAALLGPLPGGLVLRPSLEADLDFLQVFVRSRAALERQVTGLKACLTPAGMLWICWPKKSSPLSGDLTGDVVRRLGLAAGLVDVKVCAIDADWSGLKFVYRLKDR